MGEQSGPPESLCLLDAGVNFFDSAEMCASFFYHPTPLPETPQPLKQTPLRNCKAGTQCRSAGRRTGAARSSPPRRQVAGPSGQMTWIRGGPVALDSRNITEAIDSRRQVAGPSGQMTWICGGPVALDSRNITEAIDSSLRRLGVDYIDLYQIHWPDRYVPMFGETDYDLSCQYASVLMEEQLEALGKGIDAGKNAAIRRGIYIRAL
ncbi:hypothetical protein ACQ4PT_001919 [Festuca glaucescens]